MCASTLYCNLQGAPLSQDLLEEIFSVTFEYLELQILVKQAIEGGRLESVLIALANGDRQFITQQLSA